LLDVELQKIAHYFLGNSDKNLTFGLIHDLIHRTPEDNIFLLTESLSSKNIKQAHAILIDLMKNKEEPIKLLIMIGNHFRLMRQVQALAAQGQRQPDIASQLSIHPYRTKLLMQQAGKFSKKSLDDYIHFIANMDFQIKSGEVSGPIGLELVILNAPT